MDSSRPAAPPAFPATDSQRPEVSIIIPARNEEVALGDCLASLTAQSDVRFEILVVDDASTDRTREIAHSFPQVQVISASPAPEDFAGAEDKKPTGKNNALIAGVKIARANWLLFTDADTVHLTGSLARSLSEATSQHIDLLSYSPEQVVATFAERAVMPIIFAELARQYPPHKVREQNSKIVAANGQYILVRRGPYETVGGHAAVATEILEDVALARLFRAAGYRVHLRYGADAVRTRMYRNWLQLREGWTKNLALLFPRPRYLAFQNLFLWFAAWITLGLGIIGAATHHFASIWLWLAFAAIWSLLYLRISAANFKTVNNLIATAAGPPIFAYLLRRSNDAHAKGQVEWKGRTYPTKASNKSANTSKDKLKESVSPTAAIETAKLRIEN